VICTIVLTHPNPAGDEMEDANGVFKRMLKSPSQLGALKIMETEVMISEEGFTQRSGVVQVNAGDLYEVV